jgi:hypothetical protein
MTIFLPFLLSLDSLFSSFALGALRVERNRQVRLAVAIGLCDAAASCLHAAWKLSLENANWPESSEFRFAVGLYLFFVYLTCFLAASKPFPSSLMWTVPFVLSIDNLVSPSVSPISPGSVLLLACASSSMSLVGFRIGTSLGDMVRKIASERMMFRRVIT